MTPPPTFITYSWDNEIHKEWVRSLAGRLRKDGVNVTLDRWHTAPGDQLPAFMERAIRDTGSLSLSAHLAIRAAQTNAQVV